MHICVPFTTSSGTTTTTATATTTTTTFTPTSTPPPTLMLLVFCGAQFVSRTLVDQSTFLFSQPGIQLMGCADRFGSLHNQYCKFRMLGGCPIMVVKHHLANAVRLYVDDL
jgi:hypothetical protein